LISEKQKERAGDDWFRESLKGLEIKVMLNGRLLEEWGGLRT